MGRKINFEERPKKGPGRKARKQKDPVFDKNLLKGTEDDPEGKKLSHRQKVRAKKRNELKAQKQEQNKQAKEKKGKQRQQKKEKAQKRKYESDDEEEEDEGRGSPQVEPERLPMNVQKAQQKYAKLAKAKPVPQQVEEDSEEEEESDDEPEQGRKRDILASDDSEEEEEDDDDSDAEPEAKVGKLKGFMEDSDDDSGEEDEEEDDDDDEDALPIERAGKKLRKKQSEDERLAREELEEQMANKAPFEFPDENEQVTNIQDVHMRIKEVIGVLSDFSVNRDKNRSRSEYMELLQKDLCLYYSYNEFFMQLLIKLFSPNELLEFLEASEVQRPLTIRTNSLKTRRRDLAQALINRGVNLDPIGKWSKEGLVVYSSQVPLGATPEYLAGHYMIQGASSMLPVMALAPEENERILDMCAAPGGKSSHIAALMRNTGVLFANDVNKDRLQAVVGNFHRLGIQNAIVTSEDGTKYRDIMTGFDRVLLDAPCTGSGVISKDPSVKTTKTEIDIQRCYNLQRKLLLTAIDCLSANSETGGYLVYSTCSILPQENEWVIDYALRKRNVKLVPTGLDFGAEGLVNFCGQKYHPSMKLTRRFYPHTFNMDGFFVAKLQKFSDAIPKTQPDEDEEAEEEDEKESGIEDLGSDEATEQPLPKKIDKRDWYYKDIIEKRKKAREDPNHVVKVFEKPVKKEKKNKEEPKIVTPEQSPAPAKTQSSKKKKKQLEEVATPVSTPLKAQTSTKKKKVVEEVKTPQVASPPAAKSQSSMKKKKLKVDAEEVATPKASPVTPKVKSSAKKKKLKVEG
ncbi:uncharacterized protein LOC120415849 [Culex pipiens pallens]|uniref:uncharacterized protein LOC120415849 n=1 Tax=Culex pipiens pallens TaxID=42434 RepID=UPI001952D018|nr:uncharacterized protein LOC120415849 [Culex pipiens pallens]